MPTLALYAADRIVAYLRLAGDDLATGPVVRDAALDPAPTDAQLLATPAAIALEPFLDDARSAQVVVHPDRATIHVGLSQTETLVVDVDLAGTGTWRLGNTGGPCLPDQGGIKVA